MSSFVEDHRVDGIFGATQVEGVKLGQGDIHLVGRNLETRPVGASACAVETVFIEIVDAPYILEARLVLLRGQHQSAVNRQLETLLGREAYQRIAEEPLGIAFCRQHAVHKDIAARGQILLKTRHRPLRPGIGETQPVVHVPVRQTGRRKLLQHLDEMEDVVISPTPALSMYQFTQLYHRGGFLVVVVTVPRPTEALHDDSGLVTVFLRRRRVQVG